MQWSKLKTRIKALICPELRDVIDFHVTRYREAHSWISESWITVNGQKIFGCGSRTYFIESQRELDRIMRESPTSPRWPQSGYEDTGQALVAALEAREIHEPQAMGDVMRAYLEMPIDEALESSDPFIKALALVDRRVGKRTIASLEIAASAHTLVKAFYELRLAAAHI
jgi:hypothetical protein